MRDQTVLAANLLPGDVLLSGTMSGPFDAEVLGVNPGPVVVEVVLAGRSQPAGLCPYEICSIRRAAAPGTPSEVAGWEVDASACEVVS